MLENERRAPADDQQPPSRDTVALRWGAWVPVGLAIALIGALLPTRNSGAVGPQWISPVLNGVFAILVLLLVAILAARSVLAGERRSLVFLGSGMLAYAAVSAVGAVSVLFGHLSEGVRVLNIGQLTAGAANLAGCIALLAPSRGSPGRTRLRVILACYLGILALVAAVTWAAYAGLIPPFLQPGVGPTIWRRIVLAATIVEFAAACACLLVAGGRARSRFLLLYALGLGLIAAGTAGIYVIRTVGNPLGWAGTVAVYTGMAYLLAAVVVAVRRSGRLNIPVEFLKETRQRYLSLVEQSPDAIVILVDGRFVFANPIAARLYGAAAGKDLVGRASAELMPPEFREKALARRRRAAALDRPLPLEETTILRLDGTPVEIEVAAAAVEYEGRAAIQMVMRDITARKRAEEALRKAHDELEQRVTARTAELRRLNLSLENQADQLRRLSSEVTVAEQRERKRLALILHDNLQQLLTAARFRADFLHAAADEKVRTAAADVDTLLSQAIDASRTLTGELSPPILFEAGLLPGLKWLARWMEDKHGLNVDLAAEEPAVPLDEGASIFLFRSVRELLFNALKHGQVKTAAVRMTVEEGNVVIVVEDKGVGFDPGQADRGGIGLFGIREQLVMRGGRLEVSSAAGKGSTFRIVMPLDFSALPPRDSSAPTARGTAVEPGPAHNGTGAPVSPRSAPQARRIRVLLVDDHPIVRKGLVDLLGRYPDIEVIGEAVDGEQAVAKTLELDPDVVVMDVSMPKMSGIEATASIHRERPDVRIIGLTLYEASDQAGAMLEAGASAFVMKSGPTDAIIEAIRQSGAGAAAPNPRSTAARH